MNSLGTATASRAKWARPQPDASLAPGTILFASEGSFDHYFRESLVLLTAHDEKGSVGVLLNHQTPWKVEEMAPGALAPFSANSVFLGGDAGRDTMMMIHGEAELPGAVEVGRGVYRGGVAAAEQAVEQGALPPDRFKFFYKTVEWLPRQLEEQVDSGVFEPILLSPGWLFGPSGHRSMWEDVRDHLMHEQETEEKQGPALASSEGKGKGEEEANAAREAHDAKTRALVERIKAEEASGNPTIHFSLGSDVQAEKARFEDKLREIERELQPRYGGAGEGSGAKSSAEQAAAWLAEQGIVPGEMRKRESMSVEQLLELSERSEREAAEKALSSSPSEDASSADSKITHLSGYRVFKGNEQWRVHWQAGEEASWEVWGVLDTAELRERAEQLREDHLST